MIDTIILSFALLGQCSGGSCQRPTASVVVPMAPFAVIRAYTATIPVIRRPFIPRPFWQRPRLFGFLRGRSG